MSEFCATSAPAAFEQLVGRHASAAYRTARAFLGTHYDAEDAVQECFLRAVRARGSYRPDMRFATWLFAILRNICRDHGRLFVHTTDGTVDACDARTGARLVTLDDAAQLACDGVLVVRGRAYTVGGNRVLALGCPSTAEGT